MARDRPALLHYLILLQVLPDVQLVIPAGCNHLHTPVIPDVVVIFARPQLRLGKSGKSQSCLSSRIALSKKTQGETGEPAWTERAQGDTRAHKPSLALHAAE